MHPFELIGEIRKSFTPNDGSELITSLQLNSLAWNALLGSNFYYRTFQKLGNQLHKWTPGNLGLIDLDSDTNANDLKHIPLIPLSTNLRQRSVAFYEKTLKNPEIPYTLSESCLVALALRERRRITCSWEGIASELLQTKQGVNQTVEVWKYPLSCLFGIIPDPAELLRELIPVGLQFEGVEWVIFCLFSNPMSDRERGDLLYGLLVDQTPELQRNVLSRLQAKQYYSICESLAKKLLTDLPVSYIKSAEIDQVRFSDDIVSLIQSNLYLYKLFQLSGNKIKALSYLNRCKMILQTWLGSVEIDRMNFVAGVEEKIDLLEIISSSEILKSGFASILSRLNNPESYIEKLDNLPVSPFIQLKKAELLFEQGDTWLAKEVASQAVSGLLDYLNNNRVNTNLPNVDRIGDYIKTINKIGMPGDAECIARFVIKNNPRDYHVLSILCDIYQENQQSNLAIGIATQLAAINPGDPYFHRKLAELLENAGDWQQALAERQEVLQVSSQENNDDLIALARCALQVERYDLTQDACLKVLQQNQNSGEAFLLSGIVKRRLGNNQAALIDLERATQLIPEYEDAWLQLSDLHSYLGNENLAISTLRTGAFAIPSSAKILLALANQSIESGKLTEALPYLYKALELDQADRDIPQKLGHVLNNLGHYEEAERILGDARLNYPNDPELAFEHALSLYNIGDSEKALDVLDVAIRNPNSEMKFGLLYGQILIGFSEKPMVNVTLNRIIACENALHSILAKTPDHLDANLLLAEVLYLKDELKAAYQVYSRLAELNLPPDYPLGWRIYWGLGKTAYALNNLDTALAALEEAAQKRPSSVPIYQLLCEAYLSSDFIQEAANKATIAIQLAPAELSNLEWYASVMAKMNKEEEALNALRCAVEIRPDRSDLWIRLAQMQIKSGDIEGTRASLSALVELPVANIDDLRRASETYMRLQDMPAALHCLEKALNAEEIPTSDLLIETSVLYDHVGNTTKALETIDKVLSDEPDHVIALIHRSDYLEKLNQPSDSYDAMEKAMKLAEKNVNQENRESQFLSKDESNHKITQNLMGDIHHRMCRLLYRLGNYQNAYHHALIALDLKPFDLEVRYLAGSIVRSMLNLTKAIDILSPISKLDRITGWNSSQPFDVEKLKLALIGILSEISLESKKLDEAGTIINNGLEIAQTERLLLSQINLLVFKKDLVSAELLFQTHIAKVVQDILRRDNYHQVESDIYSKDRLINLAITAAKLEKWEEALLLADLHINSLPNDPRGFFTKMAIMYTIGERQYLANLLKISAHAPGVDYLEPSFSHKFYQCVERILQLIPSVNLDIWLQKGKALFEPGNVDAGQEINEALADENHAIAYLLARRKSAEKTGIRQVVDQYKNSPEVLIHGVLSYLDVDPKEGILLAHTLVGLEPENPVYLSALALLAQEAGDLDTSLKALSFALSIWGDEIEWHKWAGKLALALGDTDHAVMSWEKAFKLDPNNIEVKFSLGQAYLENGDISQAVSKLREVTDENPHHAEGWYCLAEALKRAGRLEDAFQASLNVIKNNPRGSKGYYQAAEIIYQQGDLDKSLEYCEKGLANHAHDIELVQFTASLYQEKGRCEDALDLLDRTINQVPGSVGLHILRSKILKQKSGLPEAISYLEKIQQEFPGEPSVLFELAVLLEEHGDLRASEKAAMSAVKSDVSNAKLLYLVGRIEKKFGQLDQSVYYLSEAVRLDPRLIQAFLDLGEVYQMRREHAQAIRVYQQAIKSNPDDYRPYYQAALLLRESKDYSGAEVMLRRAAALSPDDLNIRRQLGAVIALNLVFNAQEVGV